jgi:[protein-PII] uridylyltransferase
VLGYTTKDGYHVGRREVSATAKAFARLELHLEEVLRLLQLARTEGKRISQDSWYFVYRTAPQYSNMLSRETATAFLKLLDRPERLGELLRRLLELGVLEKIIPDFAHARCLLQFNQYHKYTVDEHSIRAVEEATHFSERKDALGETYIHLQDKRMLHLALLIHDLGKYSAEFQKRLEGGRRVDHSTAGAKELKTLLKSTPQEIFAELLAFPITGHHTGLLDYGDESDLEGSTLCIRLKNDIAFVPIRHKSTSIPASIFNLISFRTAFSRLLFNPPHRPRLVETIM